MFCKLCNRDYTQKEYFKHNEDCLNDHVADLKAGEDYVDCHLCGRAVLRLGEHLKRYHGLSREEVLAEKRSGRQMIASVIVDKWKSKINFSSAKKKRRATNKKRYGHENVFTSPSHKKKILATNRRRYGVDHPMQCSEIFIKNQKSNQRGKTGLEQRFDELTPENVVFTGYGGRIIQVKTPVEKAGVKGCRLCPDFMIFKGPALEAAISCSSLGEEMRELSSGFVIELFGDHWHSKECTGVEEREHERQVVAAYQSVGISCLVLWESDVINHWDTIKKSVIGWIDAAISGCRCSDGYSFGRDILRSLDNPSYWRSLEGREGEEILGRIVSSLREAGYPHPDESSASLDLRRFMDWASRTSGVTRGTRYGLDCCRHYTRSMVRSRVKGLKSFQDLWDDELLMERTVRWCLENGNGRHTPRRILSSMCHKNGFRTLSNLSPAKVFQWVSKYQTPVKGGIFYDPCAGWGGRMLAAHALGMKYVAIDANSVLVEELRVMASELNIDAEVYHGDSSCWETVELAMAGRQADLAFTSPPYFDKEIYSEDAEQSIMGKTSKYSWELKFLTPMVKNTLSILKEGGSFLMNIDKETSVSRLHSLGADIQDRVVSMESSRKNIKERLVRIGYSLGDMAGDKNLNEPPPPDSVECLICGKRLRKVLVHVRATHGMSKAEYLEKFPSAVLVSESQSRVISSVMVGKKRGSYKSRVSYRCKDGRVVRRKPAWMRSWYPEQPPLDSILDGSVPDKWEGKSEGVDYVVCSVCGYKGVNITRHIKSKHGIEKSDYNGQLKSDKSLEKLQAGSAVVWEKRRAT